MSCISCTIFWEKKKKREREGGMGGGERERERERRGEGGMGGREGEREYSTTRHKLLKLQQVLFMKISGVMHISVVVDATES